MVCIYICRSHYRWLSHLFSPPGFHSCVTFLQCHVVIILTPTPAFSHPQFFDTGWDRVSLNSPGCPGNYFAPASRMLRLKVSSTAHCLPFVFCFCYVLGWPRAIYNPLALAFWLLGFQVRVPHQALTLNVFDKTAKATNFNKSNSLDIHHLFNILCGKLGVICKGLYVYWSYLKTHTPGHCGTHL